MSVFETLAGVLRPRPMSQAVATDGPASSTSYAVVTADVVAAPPPPPPPIAIPESAESEEPQYIEPSDKEKAMMLWLSNVSHACNHFQNQMLTMLYTAIMADLGMSYMELGMLSAVRSVINTFAQGCYGLLTPFVSRCKILGFGNFGIALGTFMSGLAPTYPFMVLARGVGALGSSAQHPVGYSLLASYFPKKRGSVIALNTSASNVGTLIATPLAGAMLIIMGWRQVFYVVAFISLIMGVVYLIFRDYGAPNRAGSGRARLAQGLGSYARVLKNRNMMIIALVFMIGAAGAEGGINQTYFTPHLANDFGYSIMVITILISSLNVGQIVGPIVFGRISDRVNRVVVLQTSLVLSGIGTFWIANMGASEVAWVVGLFLFSAVTSSRGTLTQAIVADTASDADRDAAFSMYFTLGFLAQPFWLLVTGFLMDNFGFATAMERTSVSYVLAAGLLLLLKTEKKPEAVAS